MSFTTRIRSLSAMIIVLSCVVSACTDLEDLTEPETNPEDLVNTDDPNSNDLIVSEVVIGDEGKWSSLWEIVEVGTGGYYYRGAVNSRYGGGHLDPMGGHVWHCRTTYSPTGICMSGPASALPDALILAGGYDSDDDSYIDIGQISLISSSGTLQNMLVYSSDTLRVSFYSAISLSDSDFVAVGGVKDRSETYYPFVALFSLASSGQLEKQSETIISSLPGMYFYYAVQSPDELSDSEVVLYVNSKPDAEALHKISFPLPALEPVTIEWTRQINVPSVSDVVVKNVSFFDGVLYWAGSAEDPSKDPPPSNGGYWSTGVVGSYTSEGVIRWTELIQVTGHSDRFYEIAALGDTLYVVGQCGNFGLGDQQFGYGWICGIDAATGTSISDMTFGDPKNSSGFNSGICDGSLMHCVGWTHQEVSGYYQGWYCLSDIAAAMIGTPANSLLLPRNCDGAMSGDRRYVNQDGGRTQVPF